MTIQELILQLNNFSPQTRITLLDPDTRWNLKIRIVDCDTHVAITGDYSDDGDADLVAPENA